MALSVNDNACFRVTCSDDLTQHRVGLLDIGHRPDADAVEVLAVDHDLIKKHAAKRAQPRPDLVGIIIETESTALNNKK